MYVNDFFVLGAHKRSFDAIRNIFYLYKTLTNERINLSKYNIFFLKNTPISVRRDICNFFKFKKGFFPFKHSEAFITFSSLVQYVIDKIGS